jgi:hypothetical protein
MKPFLLSRRNVYHDALHGASKRCNPNATSVLISDVHNAYDRVNLQDTELAQAGARALSSLLTTPQNVKLAVDRGAIDALMKLACNTASPPRLVDEALSALAAVARSGDDGSSGVIKAEALVPTLCMLLTSRDSSTRKRAAFVIECLSEAHEQQQQPGSPPLTSSTGTGSVSSPNIWRSTGDATKHVLERRRALAPCVDNLVAELKRQSQWLFLWCSNPEAKGMAARALGHLSLGCSDNMEAMMRAGCVQALMKILRMKCLWTGRSSLKLLRLKGDAAYAVAAIARAGDLTRGRLQEAGAIQALEQLWTAQVVPLACICTMHACQWSCMLTAPPCPSPTSHCTCNAAYIYLVMPRAFEVISS